LGTVNKCMEEISNKIEILLMNRGRNVVDDDLLDDGVVVDILVIAWCNNGVIS
jgi:hypothetical protein